MDKRQLRQMIREETARMDPDWLARASDTIVRRVLALQAWQEAHTVMAYASLPTEPDTGKLIHHALTEEKRLLLPRCVDRTRMEAVSFTGWEHTAFGAFGIREPEGEAAIERPQLILTPCVAATAQGDRLGHGAGYYDRFLRDQTGLRVCLCFQRFLLDRLPVGELDVRMDLVITEETVYQIS